MEEHSTINWRKLCEELASHLQDRKDRECGWPGEDPEQDLLDRVHALLAQPEPEVVGPTMQLPEQAPDEHPPSNLDRREIAAWYHGHGCGWQAARAVLARYGRPAPAPAGDDARIALAQPEPEVVGPTDEEWDALVDRLWDQYKTVGYQGERFMYEGDFNTALDLVRQKIARWGRPAPASDYRGVLPMIVSETGAADEPELERIICAAISGGADYVNNMPRELVLERITPEGSTFERYIQADVDTHSDVRPAPAPAGEVVELVGWLRLEAYMQPRQYARLTRAADLLEQRNA